MTPLSNLFEIASCAQSYEEIFSLNFMLTYARFKAKWLFGKFEQPSEGLKTKLLIFIGSDPLKPKSIKPAKPAVQWNLIIVQQKSCSMSNTYLAISSGATISG